MAVVVPGLPKRHRVRSALIGWVLELNGIVLPEAHLADLVGAGRFFLERQVAATRARIPRRGHELTLTRLLGPRLPQGPYMSPGASCVARLPKVAHEASDRLGLPDQSPGFTDR